MEKYAWKAKIKEGASAIKTSTIILVTEAFLLRCGALSLTIVIIV